jgi:hypothetical protein
MLTPVKVVRPSTSGNVDSTDVAPMMIGTQLVVLAYDSGLVVPGTRDP